jgi:fructose-bisphosphate aldolase class II
VVEMAHSKGVWVQGEVGGMVGTYTVNKEKNIEIPLADINDVVEFVKQTGVDSIAAAVGTAHGIYQNEDINFDLLNEVIKITKTPFVLHGGSGIEDEKIKQAIKAGVDVINIGTDIKVAFCSSLIKNCSSHPEETDPRNLLKPTIEEVARVAMIKMELFGSANRIQISEITT